MTDQSHLDALELGLSHERVRLANARTADERKLRQVWVAQYEREIASEKRFLGIADIEEPAMTIDDILAELDSIFPSK